MTVLSDWWHRLADVMHELSQACAVEQTTCEAYQDPGLFDLWPVLLPIVAVVALVGLGFKVAEIRRGGKP